ncbi:MAG: hypothetical protein ACI85F_002257 [Bacteroidia bacterium]|jgi:hypothetical protein
MMAKFNIGLIALIIGLIGQFQAKAQVEDLPDSMTYYIVKEYQPVARDANKVITNPTMEFDTTKPEMPTYSVLPRAMEVESKVDPIKAAKLSNEPLKKLHRGYAKVGFGNYTMPLFEAGIGSLRSKKFQYGLDLRHFSSFAKLNDVPFGFSENKANLYGKYFLKHHVVKANVLYDRDVSYRFGYDTGRNTLTKDDIRQRYSHIEAGASFSRYPGRELKIFDNVAIGYHNTQDLYGSIENGMKVGFGIKENIKKEEIHVDGAVRYFHNQKPLDTTNNTIVDLTPKFKTSRKRWNLEVGVTLSLDIHDSATKVLIFPELDFEYYLVEDIMKVYAGATGGVKRNGLRELSQLNPYMGDDQPMLNTWERLNIYAGFKGTIISDLGFDVGVSEAAVNQHLFWVNDYSDKIGNEMLPVYHDVRVFTIRGELFYRWKNKLTATAGANYRFFTMSADHLQPWSESPFSFYLTGRYTLRDKIIARIDLMAYGPRETKDVAFFGSQGQEIAVEVPRTIAGFVDLNIGIEYRYRHWIGAFIDVRNIAGTKNEKFNRYRSQSISVIGGLNFAF